MPDRLYAGLMDTRSDDEIRADLSYLFDKASQALAARMGTVLGELGMTVRDYCVLSKAGVSMSPVVLVGIPLLLAVVSVVVHRQQTRPPAKAALEPSG